MTETKDTLQSDALELHNLNRLMVKSLAEKNFEALIDLSLKYLRAKKRVKTKLLDQPTIKVLDQKALKVLRDLVGDKSLPADNIADKLIAALRDITKEKGDLPPLEYLDDEEIESLGSDLFYSWFSHYEYLEGMFEIGSLVAKVSVPENLRSFIEEGKKCYAFQQYNAVYSLCRTILEASIRNICSRKKLIEARRGNVINLEDYRWCDLRDAVSPRGLKDQINKLYSRLSSLIHGRKAIVKKDEAKEAFKMTLNVVHALYNYHGF
jgi:hypothetical protein